VKLLPFSYNVICSRVKSSRTRWANSEVDRLRDVREENGLLFFVLEEAQRARCGVEINLQHHRRSAAEFPVSVHPIASVYDVSSPAATKNEEMREEKGEETGSRQSRGLVEEKG
jgi:hypothetical protein